jgi:FkbM family methyltransferase
MIGCTANVWKRVKNVVRTGLAAPGIRHGLRWFLHQGVVPQRWRDIAHRRLAKAARFPEGAFFDYETPSGVPLRFLYGGTSSNYLYWLRVYEPATTALFAARAREARVVLDIGAADGIYAVLAAAANPSARVLAFEPGEAAAAMCRTNFALNAPLTNGVELHAMALGERDTEATLYVAGETGGTSSLNACFRRDRHEQRVTVRSGDALLRELGIERVDLIKIDTESTEPDVLRGLRATIERSHPDIICEVLMGRTEQALEELMSSFGYRFYRITEHGLVPSTRLAGDETYREPNYLFSTR